VSTQQHPQTHRTTYATDTPAPTKVTAGQVQIARWRLARDKAAGRPTPEPYRRIASVQLPQDRVS
jgi:hypothetical protein